MCSARLLRHYNRKLVTSYNCGQPRAAFVESLLAGEGVSDTNRLC